MLLVTFVREGFADYGLIEGRDVELQQSWAEGDYRALPKLASDVLDRKPDVILVNTISAASAVRSLTETTPVVMLSLNDPVRAGLVDSLARPGGNITGVATSGDDSLLKLIDFTFQLCGNLSKVSALSNGLNPSNVSLETAFLSNSRMHGAEGNVYRWTGATGLPDLEGELRTNGTGALIIMPDSALNASSVSICKLALDLRIPLFAGFRQFVDSGGVLSYGYVYRVNVRRAMYFVQKILAGEKPSALPIEQPTKFELIINLRTARLLNLQPVTELLARADELVE